MCASKLNAINNEGVEFDLLTPFFRALLPAFAVRAGEIRIEPDDSGIQISFGGKSLSVRIDSPLHNYGAIAFARILILAEMSIALEGTEQSGRVRVRFGQHLFPVDVVSRRDAKGWYLVFRPAWAEAKADVDHELSA